MIEYMNLAPISKCPRSLESLSAFPRIRVHVRSNSCPRSVGLCIFRKIYTALRRSAVFQTKALKDIAQASSLAEVLIADRPDDLRAAWRELAPYPKVSRRIERAFDRLPAGVAGALRRMTAESGGAEHGR